MHFATSKPPLHSTLLYVETDGDLCGHFSNPYITLHLEDFDFFPNAFTSTFVVDVNNEVVSSIPIHVPTIVTNPIFHSTFDDVASTSIPIFYFSIDDVAFTSNPFIQVMAFGFNVVEKTNYEYPIMELIMKSWFLEIDYKEMENVNKGGRKMSKHAKLWVKNAFDEWKLFCCFDITKSITDLIKNKGLNKGLVDMLSSFILQVTKKKWRLISSNQVHFMYIFIIRFFFFFCKYNLRFKVHVSLCPLFFLSCLCFCKVCIFLDLMFVSSFGFGF